MLISERLCDIAKGIALASHGVGPKLTFKVGAIIFDRRSRVAASCFNSYKTHPGLSKHYRYPCTHAEAGVILKAKRKYSDLSQFSLLVVRVNKLGRLTMAKPCNECSVYIQTNGLHNVYYSNWHGEIENVDC